MKIEDLTSEALEVVDSRTDELVGWVWREKANHGSRADGWHWRYATVVGSEGEVYASPYGFLAREHAVARVAVTKDIVSHHLRVQGDS